MKSFRISIVIFAVMILIIISNYLYISKISNQLCAMLQSIPSPTTPQCIQQIVILEKFWDKHSNTINLSTTATKTETISSDIVKLKHLALNLEISDFEVTRHQLLSTIRNIQKAEKLSFKNII